MSTVQHSGQRAVQLWNQFDNLLVAINPATVQHAFQPPPNLEIEVEYAGGRNSTIQLFNIPSNQPILPNFATEPLTVFWSPSTYQPFNAQSNYPPSIGIRIDDTVLVAVDISTVLHTVQPPGQH